MRMADLHPCLPGTEIHNLTGVFGLCLSFATSCLEQLLILGSFGLSFRSLGGVLAYFEFQSFEGLVSQGRVTVKTMPHKTSHSLASLHPAVRFSFINAAFSGGVWGGG